MFDSASPVFMRDICSATSLGALVVGFILNELEAGGVCTRDAIGRACLV